MTTKECIGCRKEITSGELNCSQCKRLMQLQDQVKALEKEQEERYNLPHKCKHCPKYSKSLLGGYCSLDCMLKAGGQVCKVCGKGTADENEICSTECRSKVACVKCDNLLPDGQTESKYCSEKCKPKIMSVCEECKEEFESNGNNICGECANPCHQCGCEAPEGERFCGEQCDREDKRDSGELVDCCNCGEEFDSMEANATEDGHLCDGCNDGSEYCKECGEHIGGQDTGFCSEKCNRSYSANHKEEPIWIECERCFIYMDEKELKDGKCRSCIISQVCSSCREPSENKICDNCPKGEFKEEFCYRCSQTHNPKRGAKVQSLCNPCIANHEEMVGCLKRKRVYADPPSSVNKKAKHNGGAQDTVSSVNAI